MKRSLVVLFILAAALGWSQQYIDDLDGRNWNGYSAETKAGITKGMMMYSIFIDEILVWCGENGIVVPERLYSILEYGGDTGGLGTLDISRLIDAYYLTPANITTSIYMAYFFCIRDWKNARGE